MKNEDMIAEIAARAKHIQERTDGIRLLRFFNQSGMPEYCLNFVRRIQADLEN